MKSIYVFGHKNPDTDSVASAITLSYLKNELGMPTVPKVIGPINRETRFVLDYFKVPTPSYLNDVKIEINDIKYTKKAFVSENESIESAFEKMKEMDLTGCPIVDDKNIIIGYVTLKDMAKYLMQTKKDYLHTSLKHLISSLKAKIICNFDIEFSGKVYAAFSLNDIETFKDKLNEKDILIISDNQKNLEVAIDKKVKLIILSNNLGVGTRLLNKAIKNKVNIISSDESAFDIANQIPKVNYIKTINQNENPLTIDIRSYRSDFEILAKKYNYTNYPVVKKNGECLGVLKLQDASNYKKKDVILVDHNNYEQSIEGINEANILEVFDHHNIGNIGTNTPIYFTSRPVGCTATIIYDHYKKEKVAVPKDMAGLLLSAIISDTLLFTSPTTTEEDIKTVGELAKIAKVNVEKYGIEMLKAASSIKGLSVNDLINQDFKQYSVNEKIYGIAQITTMEFEEISNKMDEYISRLDEMCENMYAGAFMFVTDVLKGGSYVVFNSDSKALISKAFDQDMEEGMFLKGIVSRKKQILPAILSVVQK